MELVTQVTAVPLSSISRITNWCEANRKFVGRMIGELVQIPTIAPYEPDGFAKISEYIKSRGFNVRVEPPHPEIKAHPEYTAPFLPGRHGPRPNLRATRHFDSEIPTILFSAHLDVVPPLDHPEPWSGRFDGMRVHGRGSADTKNNIVMAVEALRCLDELGIPLRANVAFDIVTDEEAGGNGALSTIMSGSIGDEVVVLEPTGLDVHHGHRGCLAFEVVAEGNSGHMGSAPVEWSPIEDCLLAVERLRALEAAWLAQGGQCPGFDGVRRPIQLNLTGIHADGWHGGLTKRCALTASLGFLPDRTLAQARAEIAAAVLSGEGAERISISWNGIHNDAYLGPVDGPVSTHLRCSAGRFGHKQEAPRAWHVSCDARLYARNGTGEVVVFGSGELSLAHTDHEYVEIDQVLRGVAVLVDFLALPPTS